ncbi:MAG: hypothetical protein R8P61_37755 [Bacteroidia bacterium]|nr:hypothetical protein [Bacteroidia bacterium]
MEELSHILSSTCIDKLRSLQELATELDKDLSYHMLISLNEEGFMVKNPNYSEFLQQWLEDYVRRKEHYSSEELLDWLKAEREKELEKFKVYREVGRKTYFKKFLGIIRSEIAELGEEESKGVDKSDLLDLIRDDKLAEVMDKLEKLFEEQEVYEDTAMELILHQGRLSELERLYAQNLMEEKDYLMEKAELRRALILILREI